MNERKDCEGKNVELKENTVTLDYALMHTLNADGHWWIIVRTKVGSALAFQHHPDCSCGKGGK